MKRSLLVLLLLGAIVPSSAGAAERCAKSHATVVVQNASARVFYVKGKGPVKRRYYGCRRGQTPALLTSTVSPKADDETHTGNAGFRLTGTYVAWVATAFSDFGVGEFGRSIELRPLAPGGRKVSQDVSDYNAVTALAVRADGAVAWILKASANYNEVDAVASGARTPTALAYARGIEKGRLSFDAAAVHWTQDGADRSAPLP
jgi:hypothetical protein